MPKSKDNGQKMKNRKSRQPSPNWMDMNYNQVAIEVVLTMLNMPVTRILIRIMTAMMVVMPA
jgi:hypothetical protein